MVRGLHHRYRRAA